MFSGKEGWMLRNIKHDSVLEGLISERVALEIRINMLENAPLGSAEQEAAKPSALASARHEHLNIVARIARHRKELMPRGRPDKGAPPTL
jgi:hypothetical protein